MREIDHESWLSILCLPVTLSCREANISLEFKGRWSRNNKRAVSRENLTVSFIIVLLSRSCNKNKILGLILLPVLSFIFDHLAIRRQLHACDLHFWRERRSISLSGTSSSQNDLQYHYERYSTPKFFSMRSVFIACDIILTKSVVFLDRGLPHRGSFIVRRYKFHKVVESRQKNIRQILFSRNYDIRK